MKWVFFICSVTKYLYFTLFYFIIIETESNRNGSFNDYQHMNTQSYQKNSKDLCELMIRPSLSPLLFSWYIILIYPLFILFIYLFIHCCCCSYFWILLYSPLFTSSIIPFNPKPILINLISKFYAFMDLWDNLYITIITTIIITTNCRVWERERFMCASESWE